VNIARVQQIYLGSAGIWREYSHRSDWILKTDPQARVHVTGVAVCAENHHVRHLRGKALVAIDKGPERTVELGTFLEKFVGTEGAKEDLEVAVAELRRSLVEQNK
jgi:hypothetical protein